MTSGSKQLSDIYRQINKHFSSHNIISVLPTSGDPPDRYEITYIIPGMTQVDGEIIKAASHIIEFSLPFGFPHFPPSCKPKSALFHPDFDQAAICLGDFWEQNRSLPDLIIRLGRMISGEFFSTDNAFNEEAANWYTEHQDELPFSTALAESDSHDEISDDQTIIDIPDDTDLTADVEYIFDDNSDLDEDISAIEMFPPIELEPEINISSLRLLHKQKRHFKLVSTIKDLPSSSEEIDELLSDAEHAINEADQYNKIAQEKEQRGNADLALEGYKKVIAIVADFPTITSSIDRAERSLSMLKEVAPELLPKHKARTTKDRLDKLNLTSPGKRQKGTDRKSPTPDAKDDPELSIPQKRWSNKLKFTILFWVLLHAGGIGTYFYIKAHNNRVASAEQSYHQCLTELDENSFAAAHESCTIALQLSENVKFSLQQSSRGLTEKIQTILQSEKLTQGLAGKTLVEGQYLLKEEAETLVYFNELKIEGTDLISRFQWSEATEKLTEAVDIAKNNSFINTDTVTSLTSELQYIKLQIDMLAAADQIERKSWQEAITRYTAVLVDLKSFPADVQHRYEEQLQQKLAESRFEDQKQKADNLFAGAEWQQAISAYQDVLILDRMNNNIYREVLTEISTKINRAKLYHTIIGGNIAFNSGSWDDAISAYQTAQSLLVNSEGLDSQTSSGLNIRKLEKIILRTSSIKNLKTAEKFTAENNLPAAKISYEKIVHDIEVSPFKNDSNFIKITQESNDTIAKINRDIFLNEKQLHLETNYQKLFPLHFPSISSDNLTHPVITFIKESPEALLFKLQCRDSGSGRPLSLIMYYTYDKKTGIWKFSPGLL